MDEGDEVIPSPGMMRDYATMAMVKGHIFVHTGAK